MPLPRTLRDVKQIKKLISEVNPKFDETVEIATQLLTALDNLQTFSFHMPQFCLVLPN